MKEVISKAFIFPGQGSQKLGMGKALAQANSAAAHVFEEVDEALGDRLSKIMWGEDTAALTLTENAQPAIMAVSIAVLRALEEKGLELDKVSKFVAGHSLGEYSALVASGSIELKDAAKLLRARGKAMQAAMPVGEGAMAALLGLEVEDVASFIKNIEGVAIANDNAVGQIVISGTKEGVGQTIEIAKEKGARRAIMLDVSAPFHCHLMQPAAEAMQDALADIEIKTPCVLLVENMLAAPVNDTEKIRKLLVEQVVGCVRWRESIAFMASEGVNRFYEVGEGKVLTNMVKRIVKTANGTAIGTIEEIEKFEEEQNDKI